MDFQDLFANTLTVISIILPILYFIGFAKYGKTYKIFTLYLTFIAIIQIILSVYAYHKVNNHFLFTYYFIGQFLCMSLFYFFLLNKKWIWLVTGFVIIGLLIQYIVSPASFINFNSLGVSITQSIIVLYALLYYFKLLTEKAKFLYINAGVLLYFITSILFFASGNLILKLDLPKETQRHIELVNDCLYFIFMILIFVEWYRNYRVQTEKILE